MSFSVPNKHRIRSGMVGSDDGAAANPSAILELIAAYKEAVAALVISRPFINAWPQCRDNELVIVDSALATAKRLGVE